MRMLSKADFALSRTPAGTIEVLLANAEINIQHHKSIDALHARYIAGLLLEQAQKNKQSLPEYIPGDYHGILADILEQIVAHPPTSFLEILKGLPTI